MPLDDVIIPIRGTLLHWHGEEVSSVSDAGDRPVLGLGTEVTCGIGSMTGARKMSPPKDFKHKRGIVVVVHLQSDESDRPLAVELGVQLDRAIAWFSPSQLELTHDRQEVPYAS